MAPEQRQFTGVESTLLLQRRLRGKDGGGLCEIAVAESISTHDRDGGRAATIVGSDFLSLTLRVA